MLRLATSHDYELVLGMCLKFSKTIALADHVDPLVLSSLIAQFLKGDPDKVVFLYEDKGMLAAFIQPFILGKTLAATELAWWVEPEYRMSSIGLTLVKTYEEWAQQKGCEIISMACYANNNLGPFYERLGYSLNELGYIKCLQA